jgi:DNA-binding NarL/FixJ family response regulator
MVAGMATRILLADDHPLFRRGVREVLDAEDDLEVVAEAGDGREAVELALTLELDLAILDVMMPQLTGVQAAAELARAKPHLKLLMLSSYEEELQVYGALDAGAAGYLLKAAVQLELPDACRAVMRGEPVPGSVEARRNGPPDALTRRELQVLKLVAEGCSSREIAEQLVISVNTVDRHRQNLLEKLGLHDRVELTRYAIRRGLVEP